MVINLQLISISIWKGQCDHIEKRKQTMCSDKKKPLRSRYDSDCYVHILERKCQNIVISELFTIKNKSLAFNVKQRQWCFEVLLERPTHSQQKSHWPLIVFLFLLSIRNIFDKHRMAWRSNSTPKQNQNGQPLNILYVLILVIWSLSLRIFSHLPFAICFSISFHISQTSCWLCVAVTKYNDVIWSCCFTNKSMGR